MAAIRMVIEVYGGVVQNVYVAHEAPDPTGGGKLHLRSINRQYSKKEPS